VNLNQLRVFYVAARERSHTRAARLLFITQPAVSQNIKALETFLGLPLFSKSGRQRELTPAGRTLYGHAERIFNSADEAEQAMRELGAIDRGELRVGTTKIYARYLMPSIIDAYKERHPDITVMLDEGSSEQIVKSVADLTNHLGVVGRVDLPPRMRHLPFRRIQLILVAGADHPLSQRVAAGELLNWKDLTDQALILREHGSSSRLAAVDRLAHEDVVTRVVMESGSVDFIKRYVAEGKAMAFLYEPDLRDELDAGRLVRIPLEGGELELETAIVLLPDGARTPAVRAFLQVLEESATAGWSVLPDSGGVAHAIH
jgi:DNA-binding transcriptional LysR family regulator